MVKVVSARYGWEMDKLESIARRFFEERLEREISSDHFDINTSIPYGILVSQIREGAHIPAFIINPDRTIHVQSKNYLHYAKKLAGQYEELTAGEFTVVMMYK